MKPAPDILSMSEAELRARGAEWMVEQLDRLTAELAEQVERAGLAGHIDPLYWED